MRASVMEFTEYRSPQVERSRPLVPYCFILDDAYRVVMAGPSGSADPLADMYAPESGIDVLPGPIDRVVRALTASWKSSRTASSTVTASVNDLQVTEASLHGGTGRRIAVFVQRAGAQVA